MRASQVMMSLGNHLLQIQWGDTEGQLLPPAFPERSLCWENPSMVMVVFDVTNETSFSSCMKSLSSVRSLNPDVQLPGVLVANKVDLDQRRVITPQQGQDLAETNGLEYFECSAKEMQNVDTAFYFLASEFYKMYQERVELCSSLG